MKSKRRYVITVRTYADPDRWEFEDAEHVYETAAASERQAVSNVAYRTGMRFTLARPRYDDGMHLHEVIDVREAAQLSGQMELGVVAHGR